jgi:hypothetical protein
MASVSELHGVTTQKTALFNYQSLCLFILSWTSLHRASVFRPRLYCTSFPFVLQYTRKSNLSPYIRLCPVKLVMKFQNFHGTRRFLQPGSQVSCKGSSYTKVLQAKSDTGKRRSRWKSTSTSEQNSVFSSFWKMKGCLLPFIKFINWFCMAYNENVAIAFQQILLKRYTLNANMVTSWPLFERGGITLIWFLCVTFLYTT